MIPLHRINDINKYKKLIVCGLYGSLIIKIVAKIWIWPLINN
jgi:hypothetical protein